MFTVSLKYMLSWKPISVTCPILMSFIVRNMRFKVGNMTETEAYVVNVTTSDSYAFIIPCVALMILCRVSLSDEELLLNQVMMCRAVVGQQKVL